MLIAERGHSWNHHRLTMMIGDWTVDAPLHFVIATLNRLSFSESRSDWTLFTPPRPPMKIKALKELAGDPRFIPGIYNYCDRWCERCSLSHRCLNYAMEMEEGDSNDPASRDVTNEKFWKKLEQRFRETMELIYADARERGIDLDDPDLQLEVRAQEGRERRLAAKNRPLARTSWAYLKATDEWF